MHSLIPRQLGVAWEWGLWIYIDKNGSLNTQTNNNTEEICMKKWLKTTSLYPGYFSQLWRKSMARRKCIMLGCEINSGKVYKGRLWDKPGSGPGSKTTSPPPSYTPCICPIVNSLSSLSTPVGWNNETNNLILSSTLSISSLTCLCVWRKPRVDNGKNYMTNLQESASWGLY